MVNTFVNPVVNPDANLGVSLFDETDPVRLWPEHSATEVEIVIRAVYRQVLGNAYVMESERLVVPESQLKRGELSVREFVRRVAKSELYRSRFFDNCYRYRAIELNFKHLLGRAPDNFDEMRYHSAVLDEEGFEAEIDAYIDSEEYQQVFGETIVPYYRGYKTEAGQSMLAFTNTLRLIRGASSSDKDLTMGNQPRLQRSLILNQAYGISRNSRDARQILAEVFKRTAQSVPPPAVAAFRSDAEQVLQQQYQEQETLIATLQQQLAELRPFASLGSAVTRQSQFMSAAKTETQVASTIAHSSAENQLQQQVAEQKSLIDSLQQQISEARAFGSIGEARLNKWRQRAFY
ncbi:MAG: phycobilisome linker polypeptide [Leptolyngbyaceae cyanobacterium RU_5_1]|nr:phycobilisome linker polypeptide [Leptolyngbyaceae cyanobacterium RU_5_1]